MTVSPDMMRRASVIAEVCSLLNRLDRTQDAVGLPPLEAVAASTDAQRLQHVEGLVRSLRQSIYTAGEVSTPVLIAAAALVSRVAGRTGRMPRPHRGGGVIASDRSCAFCSLYKRCAFTGARWLCETCWPALTGTTWPGGRS